MPVSRGRFHIAMEAPIEVVKRSKNEKPALGEHGCQSKRSTLWAKSALPQEIVESVSRQEGAAASIVERRSANEEYNVVPISLANHERMLPAMKCSSEEQVSAGI
ncbi:hypothetical protein NDU88_002236 [Pleurodeles waltl]|uniref:Uncharacterized protein n=1 Tax=Pleurodeles waltl TaxID=8319 RepID=A0AAV7NEV4_PLEWA|nr:hypothetical protein NDU88_002236 [Pleurodeles waltl]